MSRPRMLLLQARLPDDPMKDHELACFVERSGLPADHIVPHDLCEGPPTLSRLRSFDALSVGGSGDFYVSKEDLPQFEPYLDFLREVAALGHPTLASCFGYQSMVRALGGTIVHDPPNTEVGTYELTLTEQGRRDPLFSSLPSRFLGQMGHKDRATAHPDGLPNLAASKRSPFQALRVPDKPVWALQFHPELDRDTNLDRLRHYFKGYAATMNVEAQARAFERFEESPEASQLLVRFLRLVFG